MKSSRNDKKLEYPYNLFKALNLGIEFPTEDQILGLEFAISQLKESNQNVLYLRYDYRLTYKQIGEQLGISKSRCSQICNTALRRLQWNNRLPWIIEGYQGNLHKIDNKVDIARNIFLKEGKNEQADLLLQSPDVLPRVTSNHALLLAKVGIHNLGALREMMKNDFWTSTIFGIGDDSEKKIVNAMYQAGLIDEEFEAYKEITDKEYRCSKYLKMRDDKV